MEKKANNTTRVALIGPESTAKSTLSESLAKYYNTVWIPEHSRNYLSKINRKYSLDDVLLIAKEQLAQELELIPKANKFIFVDTELIVSKVWCEDVFNTCPSWINENLVKHQYDLYLLTYHDLPWQQDPLRENPTRRQFFFDWYEKELKKINANYTIIKGEDDTRLKNCINAIENFLASKNNL